MAGDEANERNATGAGNPYQNYDGLRLSAAPLRCGPSLTGPTIPPRATIGSRTQSA